VIKLAILLDSDTKVLVQGITGHQGRFHSRVMKEFGTQVVGGVTPGKGGQEVNDLPVFDNMFEAVNETGADTSLVFVPAPFARDACFEAMDAGIRLIVLVTERIPVLDTIRIMEYRALKNARIIGPNCPGIVVPGLASIGIMPVNIFREGNVGVVSRSGTLTYEIVNALTESGLGESTCLGMGGDPVVGTSFIDVLELFEADSQTEAIVLVGEIGGTAEEEAAEFIQEKISKPVFAYIAGQTAPPGKRMGHAGAIIARGRGTAGSKMKALKSADVHVATLPFQLPDLIHAAGF